LSLIEEMLCVPEAKEYYFIAQGMLTIDNVDDAEEMRLTDEAFDILNFSTVIQNFFFFLIQLYI
jgi:myosin heavy subunit